MGDFRDESALPEVGSRISMGLLRNFQVFCLVLWEDWCWLEESASPYLGVWDEKMPNSSLYVGNLI